jgi:hypothetical protein
MHLSHMVSPAGKLGGSQMRSQSSMVADRGSMMFTTLPVVFRSGLLRSFQFAFGPLVGSLYRNVRIAFLAGENRPDGRRRLDDKGYRTLLIEQDPYPSGFPPDHTADQAKHVARGYQDELIRECRQGLAR